MASLALTPIPVSAIEIIAHRGNACGYPENSLDAIASAWRLGVDGVEVDVRVSADGIAYLYHDEEFDGDPVAPLSYAEIVSRTAASAPRLDEVLTAAEFSGFLVVDLKETGMRIVDAVIESVRDSGVEPSRITIQTEDLEDLQILGDWFADIPLMYLVRLKAKWPFRRVQSAESILAEIRDTTIDGVSLKGRSYIDRDFIAKLRDAGYRVTMWTINKPSRAIYYQQIGVHGLITDNVSELQDALAIPVSATGCFTTK